MTQHAQDNQLRERLLQLHASGKTWVWLANKSDVNATSISNFARGRSGLEPPQYKKLLNAFGEGLKGDGGTPHPLDAQYLGLSQFIPPAIHIQVECSSWFINLQGELVAQNANVLSGELVTG